MVNKKLNQSLHRREKNFLMNDSELREGEELNKNGTLSPAPSPRGGWCNTQKPAITLAEIIIVIFIVGIIAGVFLAMPKKNVGQTDKAKYYVAYEMLKRLQDEQMAETGTVAINNGAGADGFCPALNRWLNLTSDLACGAGLPNAQLTNGMVIRNINVLNLVGGEPESRTVTVDIDGLNEGNCTNNQDCHNFVITSNGQVLPQGTAASTTDWIAFKVYSFNNNGTTNIIQTNINYNDAIAQYCCRNQIDTCFLSNNGLGVSALATNANCNGRAPWGGGPVFMEAIQPLGK